MNIIANNCVGARLYDVTNQQFPNPFMWSRLFFKDFINLIKIYNNIDFTNIDVSLEERLNHTCVKLTLDNKIDVHFGHYVYDENYDVPTKAISNGTDILYNDILTYTKKKWNKRLNRTNEEPTFLYSFNTELSKTIYEYNKYINILLDIANEVKYNIFIILDETSYDKLLQLNNRLTSVPKNITIIILSDIDIRLSGTKLCNKIKQYFFK